MKGLNKYHRADMLTPMNPFTDEHSLGKFLAEYGDRLTLLGLTEDRIKIYTDELWSGSSREHALAAAIKGLDLDGSSHKYASETLENIPGPEEV
jgi:hypothetical protein